MSNLSARFSAWMEAHDPPDNRATPAATVLALRDGDQGPEVLMVQRNSKGTFASNWVFPGGKVDVSDFGDDPDIVAASRRAATREALEEADLVVDASDLVPFSHWMPPAVVPRRFSTWFYVTAARAGSDSHVTIDGAEIVDHLWVPPADAIARHARREVELVPPTWVTLTHLSRYTSTAEALAAIASREPPFYMTRMIKADPPIVMWHGDAAYDSGTPDVPGPRHRLTMASTGWRFEEPD
jgi:8-oxo-dGTP pyrophosphatase MutT (NUDIX family)